MLYLSPWQEMVAAEETGGRGGKRGKIQAEVCVSTRRTKVETRRLGFSGIHFKGVRVQSMLRKDSGN